MFLTLLGSTLLASLVVCSACIALFWNPLTTALRSGLASATLNVWLRTIALAVVVIGVSVGSRIWELESYAAPGQLIDANVIAIQAYKSAILAAQTSMGALIAIFVAFGLLALMRKGSDEETHSKRK